MELYDWIKITSMIAFFAIVIYWLIKYDELEKKKKPRKYKNKIMKFIFENPDEKKDN